MLSINVGHAMPSVVVMVTVEGVEKDDESQTEVWLYGFGCVDYAGWYRCWIYHFTAIDCTKR